MNCKQCGTALGAADKFCGQCGSAVAAQAPQSAVSSHTLIAGMKACPACGRKVEESKQICPNCNRRFDIDELRKGQQNTLPVVGCLIAIVIALALGLYGCMTESPQEKMAREKKEKLGAAEAAENHRKGFDCLSAWDGSNTSFVQQIKSNLRNPDSFEHDETRITPDDGKGQHMAFMRYRAQNGFGGMNVQTATAIIGSDCQATIVTTGDGLQ